MGEKTDLEVEVDLHPHEAVEEGLDLLLGMVALPEMVGERGGFVFLFVRHRTIAAPAGSVSRHINTNTTYTYTHRVERPPVPLRQRVRPHLRVLLLQPARVLRLPQRHGQQRRLRGQRAVAAGAVGGGGGGGGRDGPRAGWRLLICGIGGWAVGGEVSSVSG